MKKSYIKCPYCQTDIAVSGAKMHVKAKHPEKFDEFEKNLPELKKSAVMKDTLTKEKVKGEPPKVQEPPKVPEPAKEPEKKAGEETPPKGDSFLDSFNKWLDSPEF